ncbi:MAG: protein kinase domain-containing protein [Vicinamibacterales bacterium]
MALAPGARLGAYEVVALIGAGGMGEVYRARDPRLGRDVAIKVLPAGLASDPERLQRFEQEARAAAALNHPNILAVYDIGQHEGAPYIVSELLEGGTLRERLAGGALPVRKAVEHAVQVAHGMAAAHEKGITHRDLKPENLFVTTDSRVKILDFGLAKLTQAEPGAANLSALPTTPAQTRDGIVLGTVGYMSPEQVRALAVDHRADIFAFGAVLYEMLSGRRAFERDTGVETMTAILKEDPPALPSAERQIPPALVRVVERCLEKAPSSRFQTATDLAFALENAAGQSSTSADVPAAVAGFRVLAPSWRLVLLVALAAAVATGVSVWVMSAGRSSASPQPAIRFALDLPPGITFGSRLHVPFVALSPDGGLLAYTPGGRSNTWLALRRLDQLADRRIDGTEGAHTPFFSPDGQWIGFFTADGKLRKMSVNSGTIVTICDAPNGSGATWAPDDTIIFAPSFSGGLFRVSAAGGSPQPWTTADRAKRESSHSWPQMLPDGDTVIFTIEDASKPFDDARIVAQSIRTGERRVLIDGGSFGRYVPTGHLVYARSNVLLAVPFDLRRLSVTGPPVEVLSGVSLDVGTGASQFAISETGRLVFPPAGDHKLRTRILRVDRRGTATPIVDEAPYNPSRFRLSPGGRQLAMQLTASNDDIWVLDLERGARTRLTTEFENASPVWQSDGRAMVLASDRGGPFNLWVMSLEGTEKLERLTTSASDQNPTSISSDGRLVAFHEFNGGMTGYDLMLLPLDGERKPREFLKTRFNEFGALFSPDNRYLAYVSDETGQSEVYIRAVSGEGGRQQVSLDGGTGPVWAPNSREIFFRNGNALLSADISLTPQIKVGHSRVLFTGNYALPFVESPGYDVTPDGNAFVMVQPYEETLVSRMIVVVNWFDELRRLVPTP